jgi:carboxyl-terminal processing protease
MSNERRDKIFAVLTIVALAAVTLWIGTIIGRKYERDYATKWLQKVANGQVGNSAEESKAIEEYAKQIEAIEDIVVSDNKLMQTVMAIKHHYVDEVALDDIYEVAIPTILAELDPHSEYIPVESFSAVNESLEGEFDGIGIVFNAATDTIVVLNVIPQGPSDRAGVRSGDRVLRIDNQDVAGQGIPQDSMMKLMRGPRGSEVTLSLQRRGIDNLVDVDIKRAPIEIHSIETAFILDKEANIGYIRLSQFSKSSYTEMRSAISKLNAEGMESLIIDLRGNTGGFLDQAILIANEFLPANKLIVYTEDRYGSQLREYSRGTGTSTELPLVILVDETSASSSEILAGAIQDNDRGLIIGRRTFGKGLVQAQIPFEDGSAIRLTVARYYTPTGRSIQKPYTKGEGEAYQMEIIDRYMHNELFSADSIHFDDSLKYTTPGGRTVYGGGGIMPDIFIPLDTIGITPYYTKVWNSNTIFRYTLDFTDRHRRAMDEVKSLDELEALLDSESIMEDFIEYAERNGISKDENDLATSYDIIEAQLRAYIGRNAFSDEAGFYYNIYPIDDAMKRAVEELRSVRAN